MAIILPPNSTGTTVDTVTLAGKDREIIVLGDPATAANQAAVKSATPVAGDFGIVTRPTPRKEGQTLSTTTLAANGVFTQAFQDSSADGSLFIEAAARADVASATNGFIIQESDDSADANFTRTVAAATVSAATLTIISAVIRARYWRVQYTNGGTIQASFRITSSASTLPEGAVSLVNYDTTAGNVQNVQAFGVALPAAGGAVAGGTATNPVRTDPTGTTTQPVSGTVTSNQGTAAAASSKWPIEIVDSAGVNIAAVSAANALKVDGSAVTQPVSIAAAVDVSDRAARLVGQVEGRAASGAAKAGNPNQVGGVFNTTQPTVTTGQAVELQATARGALIVASGVDAINVTPAANSSVNVAQIAGSATSTSAAGVQKVGNVGNAGAIFDGATAAAVPANAIYQGIRAAVANPTAVTVGQLVGPMADILGKQIVRLNGPRERLVTNTITLSTTTETTLIAAGAAGVFRDLVILEITNTSATAVRVDIRDATAGTVRKSYGIAANGGAIIPMDTAWPQTTAANAWTAQLSAAVTDIRINAMAVETV